MGRTAMKVRKINQSKDISRQTPRPIGLPFLFRALRSQSIPCLALDAKQISLYSGGSANFTNLGSVSRQLIWESPNLRRRRSGSIRAW